MSAAHQIGGCLCGAVKVIARIPKREIMACHCGQCRRWTGGSPLLVVGIEEASFGGVEHIGAFRISDWGERCFCTQCGTTLFWRMQGQEAKSICAGALDDQSGFTVTKEIFCDRRAPWMPPWEGAAQSTEAEEFAKLDAALANNE